MCSLLTARLQVTVSVWQRWVEHCGVSGHVIYLSGFCATQVVGGWRDLWVRDDCERQRGSKQGSYIQADRAVPGLIAEVCRLTAIAIMWWSWQGEWSWRERRVITTALLSVATSNTTTDAFFTHATRACSLACSVAQRDTFYPSLADYFISTTWQMRLGSVDRPHPQKSADLSPHLTADRSSQAVLSGCRSARRS